MTGPTARTRDLVTRLRSLQRRRHELTALKDHAGAVTALDLAASLIDAEGTAVIAEALLHACNPASTADEPPLPVAVAPAPAVPLLDEIQALLERHALAVVAWARNEPGATQRCHATYDELWASVQGLALLAHVEDLRATQADGRPS